MLERELEKLAGVNWQVCYFFASFDHNTGLLIVKQNALGISSSSLIGRGGSEDSPKRPETSLPSNDSSVSIEATLAHLEQVRLMVLGMEQRLDLREAELATNIHKAQAQSTKFEEMRKQILATTPS
jgi:hypothetical protein